MLRKASLWGLILLIPILVLTGCARISRGTEDRAEQDRKASLAALMGYMERRRQNDLPGAYDFLSKEAKELYGRDEFVRYYEKFPVMQWGNVGPVRFLTTEWARIVVYDITVSYTDGRKGQLADFAYYIHKSGSHWGVAVVNPALSRYEGNRTSAGVLELARPILAVNPYASAVHGDLFAVHLAEGNAADAEHQLNMLYKVSSPSELARYQALKAELFLRTSRNDAAIDALRKAATLAEKYPETYSGAWRASVRTTEAKLQAAGGDLPAARNAVQQALLDDSTNAEAKRLLQELSAPKS